jgi:hypothetical protein
MSAVAGTSSTANIASTILQQLLSGSDAQATAALPPALLEDVLKSTASAQTDTSSSSQSQVPAAVTQAMGDLLSGSDPSGVQNDLATLQSYFKQNPAALTSLMASLTSSTGTYDANGSTTGAAAPAAVTQALGGLLGGTDSGTVQSDLATVQNYFKQNSSSLTGVLSTLQGGSAGSTGSTTSTSAILNILLGSTAQDPLLAAIGGASATSSSASASSSALSLLG